MPCAGVAGGPLRDTARGAGRRSAGAAASRPARGSRPDPTAAATTRITSQTPRPTSAACHSRACAPSPSVQAGSSGTKATDWAR